MAKKKQEEFEAALPEQHVPSDERVSGSTDPLAGVSSYRQLGGIFKR
jgi:hypothetical protein